MRTFFLGVALTFTALFGVSTLYVIGRSGLDVISLFSLVIVAMLAIGVYGAIRNPPPDE